MVEKALIIKGPLKDLSDVLRIARAEAKKVLHTEKVNIKPLVYLYGNDDYMVVVEPDGVGCSKPLGVGRRNKET